MRTPIIFMTMVLTLLVAGCDSKPDANGRAVDDTANNKDYASTKTPLDQSESSLDIKITAEIRRAIMGDKAMSVNAQNCKIITQKGVVTLRGAVNTKAEKDAIEAKAAACAGVTRVDNELEVKNV